MKICFAASSLAALAIATAAPALADDHTAATDSAQEIAPLASLIDEVSIANTKFQLENGLSLIHI